MCCTDSFTFTFRYVPNWFKVNKLSLNVKKTIYIIFHNKSKKIGKIPEIVIDNFKINSVTSSKFLGVIVNENLTWTDHIETIRKKISKNVGLIISSAIS